MKSSSKQLLLIKKVPYDQLKNKELELIVPMNGDDGYETDDSESDTYSTSSQDTVILGLIQLGQCST